MAFCPQCGKPLEANKPKPEEKWFYIFKEHQHGPISEPSLIGLFKSAQLAPETLVWKPGLSDWTKARDIEGLISPFNNAPQKAEAVRSKDHDVDELNPLSNNSPQMFSSFQTFKSHSARSPSGKQVRPWFGWYLEPWRKYDDFKGRAQRKEYWVFSLIHFALLLALWFLIFAAVSGEQDGLTILFFIILALYVLAAILPIYAVSIRRMHDTGKSGWFVLISFLPYIGPFIFLVLAALDGDSGQNQYGPNPKDMT